MKTKNSGLNCANRLLLLSKTPKSGRRSSKKINRLLEEKESVLDMRENKERWKILCEQAAVEQDPKKLLELTKEINDLLLGKQHRLDGEAPTDTPKGSDA